VSTIFVDPVGGLAGDMLLAALVDLGAGADRIEARVATLPVDGYTISFTKEVRRGFAGRRVRVDVPSEHHHRTLDDILQILSAGDLGERPLRRATRVFERLAAAESRVHGVESGPVHFHEVGAVDAIVDVAGIAVALELLDVEELLVGPLPLGTGTAHGAHGEFPLPSPATTALLEGWPVRFTGRAWEHTTPTGAAVVAALGRAALPPAGLVLGATGTGFGARENDEGPPNMTRVMRFEAPVRSGVVDVVEASIDDMTPEAVGYLTERLLEAGALDVFVTSVMMKKQRPGVLVTALAERGAGESLTRTLLDHSTTLGARTRIEARVELEREVVEVETPHGTARVKLSRRPDGTRAAQPEYEDARRIARERGLSLREVYHLVDAAWRASSRG